MTNADSCIVTMSWARNEDEEYVLRHSLEVLSRTGHPVFITDGGSSGSFRSFLRSLPQFTVFEEKGLWPQVKKSLNAAVSAGARFILYTEPDKPEFFIRQLPQLMKWPISQDTGVVITSRSPAGLESFPAFQQMAETTVNRCCAEVTGMQLDYCYGPFLMQAQLVPYLQKLGEETGWGWRPYTFILAHRLGLQLQSFTGDFFCQLAEREDDAAQRRYRMKQLIQNVEGVLQAASAEITSRH